MYVIEISFKRQRFARRLIKLLLTITIGAIESLDENKIHWVDKLRYLGVLLSQANHFGVVLKMLKNHSIVLLMRCLVK